MDKKMVSIKMFHKGIKKAEETVPLKRLASSLMLFRRHKESLNMMSENKDGAEFSLSPRNKF